MDAAGVQRAHLVGESIGGTVVLHAACRAPDRVQTVTVSNGAHFGASIQSVAGWQRMIRHEGMANWSAFMMRARFHDNAIPDTAWRWFESQQATACPDTVLRMLGALDGADLTASLPGLRPKLLLMHPDSSPFISVAMMASLRDLVPGSILHVIGHARHGLPFSHAAHCAGLLADFIRHNGSETSAVYRPGARREAKGEMRLSRYLHLAVISVPIRSRASRQQTLPKLRLLLTLR
jgi:pimeloyl-ACP methyl ester carboxylesterase